MIKKVEHLTTQELDAITKIWLNSNIHAHDFISSDYWEKNYEAVKQQLPSATIYLVYQED
jgi:putative acetyltransferase